LLGLVKEIAPGIKRGGIIFNPETAPGGGKFYLDAFEAATGSLGIEPTIMPVRSDAEIESAIITLGREQGGLVVSSDCFMVLHIETVIFATSRNKVPAIFQDALFPERGGSWT
jgi:putative tryptophan/tyrosine transport system substrate-binding protein